MKDHIHTIPVLDALREPGHCPFCKMQRKLDQDAVDFIMGPAYMDEDVRDKTNEAGFCEDHLKKLYAVQNRLGSALLIHTHVKQIIKDTAGANPLEKAVGIFKKSESGASRLSSRIEKQQKRCYLCEKANSTFKRYIDTFFYMWHREPELIPLVKEVPSFCMPHYGMILREAENSLSKKELDSFLSVVIPLQQQAMAKLENDLDWFIQKFDYRNSDAPWKDSKDALIRAMAILKGIENE